MSEGNDIVTERTSNPSKNWSAYFLDFFMLFLAVSLGFFADNMREKFSENAKEKEYISSMIEDAETDKLNIKKAIASNNLRVDHLDSLANLSANYESSFDTKMYKHYLFGLMHPDFITPTERTTQQLKNAGGMRLIRNKKAVDIIINYDNFTEKLTNQQEFYERYQNSAIDAGVSIFNFKHFGFGKSASNRKNIRNSNGPFKITNNDKSKLIEFANLINIYAGVAAYYGVILTEMDTEADQLIKTLKQEYAVD